jgi:Ala-tRNA(Pro) deacylase
MPDRPLDNRLADGSPPVTPERLFDRLRALGIAVTTVEHPAVFTVDEAKALRGDLPGAHTKSLFLRDKKGTMWLVVCLENRTVDLKDVAGRLGAKRFSFGSAERLMRFLGVIPGAVSPFAVINDRGGAVSVAIDRGVLQQDPINLHPLDNAKTTAIAGTDLLRFLEAENHRPHIIDF